MKWNEIKVKEELEKALPYPIQVSDDLGGGWDLCMLFFDVDRDQMHITPYLNPGGPPAVYEDRHKPQQIHSVELRNAHGDSRGGCQSKSPEVNRAYIEAKIVLQKMGFNVIDHYDWIF